MDFKKLLSYNYLFKVEPFLVRSDKMFFAIGIALLALAAFFKFAALFAPTPVDKEYRQKFFTAFLSIGIAELIWYAARYQNVMFFGSHFIALLLLVILAVWVVLIAVKMFKRYSGQKETWEKEQVRSKYLPN